MRAHLTAALAALLLAGCAGIEPAGRNASRAPTPTPVARAPAPQPAPTNALPAPRPAQQQAVAPVPTQQALVTPPPVQAVAQPPQPTLQPAPQIVAAAPPVSITAPARADQNDDEVVVQGQVQRQVPPPRGDPRSISQRIEDIRAWDRCVIEVQGSAFDSDPTEPQLDTPEDACRTQLGMADRLAVPAGRRRPR